MENFKEYFDDLNQPAQLTPSIRIILEEILSAS